ncbi:unnamed protein product [Pleuronectes platessa]|uniref:Uncharacterized protein n=1 Tax=Pleuronectes platessa TaxID=8262 RepID=A0A9N7UN38_PLEPL|nr:unnamed protein product [Pleuronectes platessa]
MWQQLVKQQTSWDTASHHVDWSQHETGPLRVDTQQVSLGTQSCSRGYSIVCEPGFRLRAGLQSDSHPEEESDPQPPAFKERSPPERGADQSQRRTATLTTGGANQRGRAGGATVPVN